jgi:hypothetical protein
VTRLELRVAMDGVGFLPGRGVRKAASDGSGARQQCEARARLAMDALKRRMTREAMLLLSAPPLPAPPPASAAFPGLALRPEG